jgi:putative FmdB family regulatory protein
MPTYEFKCPEGHAFDHFFRSISSAQAVLPCPTCGRPAERLVSGGAGLLFKGSGFYITDYGKDGKKDQKAAADRSEGGASKGEAAKSEKSTSGGQGGASGGGSSGSTGSSGGSASGGDA